MPDQSPTVFIRPMGSPETHIGEHNTSAVRYAEHKVALMIAVIHAVEGGDQDDFLRLLVGTRSELGLMAMADELCAFFEYNTLGLAGISSANPPTCEMPTDAWSTDSIEFENGRIHLSVARIDYTAQTKHFDRT